METALMVILGIAALVVIVSVMLQQSSGDGASALGGSAGTAKKAKGNEALLSKITIIATVVFVVLTLVLVVIQ